MLTVHVTLTLQSPLHIGSLSPAGTAAMRGLVKARDGWPYIPASAFKGRLRHTVERLGRALRYPVCDTHRQMCREAGRACPVCRLFGSSWLPGLVRFCALELSGPELLVQQRQKERQKKLPPPGADRHGGGISRRRKVAGDQLLYTTELFLPGAELVFSGELHGLPDETAAAWLAAGIAALESLGSDRSRGLGWLSGGAAVRRPDGGLVPLSELAALLEVSA